MGSLLKDIRYGLRGLVKHKGFATIAVLTIAIGVGANTAIFSVINGVLLKALPFPEPQQLLSLSESSKEVPAMAIAYPNYLDWRAQQTTLENMSARLPAGGILTGGGEPERITGRLVNASFFATLGVQPYAGRFFNDQEDRPGGEKVIVLSQGLWQRRFGGNAAVVGQPIQLNGESWTIVGVLPGNFDYYGVNNANNDFFIPLGRIADQAFMQDRFSHSVFVTARMKPGVTLGQVQNEFNAISARLGSTYPESNAGNSIVVASFLDDYVGDIRQSLLIVFVAVALLLLIACANVANLLLARASSRKREIAIRLAMGAGRWRVIRQMLTESILLAVAGGLLGLLIATWGVKALLKLDPDALYRTEQISVDQRVLLFTLVVTILTGLVFGLAPALQTSRLDIQDTLKQNALNVSGGIRSLKLTGWFVIAELAISCILLVGAGLLVRSYHQLMFVKPGFDANNVLTFRLRLSDSKYRDSNQTTSFLKNVMQQTAGLPGVLSVGVGTGFPLGPGGGDTDYQIEGEPVPATTTEAPVAISRLVNETYHKTLGIGLLAGRYFTDRDIADTPPVVIVDDTFVRRHFSTGPISAVIGKRVRFGGDGEPWREIVGVVNHVRQNSIEEEGRAGIYRPWLQMNPKWMTSLTRALDMVVKTSAKPETFVGPIKGLVQGIDPEQPLANVRTLSSRVDESLAPRRFTLSLLGIFASMALLLGAIGLYGVMAYHVSQRTREIGIRMALGAQRGNVGRLIVKQGITLALVAVAIGLAGSWALTRLMKSLLFEVSATDPISFITPPIVLTSIALLACYIPARRATKVDPLEALRTE
jgi:putative ABC transport system permease protein